MNKKFKIIGISILVLTGALTVFFNARKLNIYTYYKLDKKGAFVNQYRLNITTSQKSRCEVKQFTAQGVKTLKGFGSRKKKSIELDIDVRKDSNKLAIKCTKGKGRNFSKSSNMSSRTLTLPLPNPPKID